MSFKKKLKIRLAFGIGYIVLGLAMIAVSFFVKTDSDFLSSFGLAMSVIGIVKVRQYIRITKTEETIQKQRIAETDERNIAIADKAKSVAFLGYILLASVAVIVLEVLHLTLIATILSATVCVLLVLYWVSYWIIRRKS